MRNGMMGNQLMETQLQDDQLLDDHLNEECGVFGIFHHPQAAELTYYALYALQHRGQESAGISSVDGKQMYQHKGMGLVADVFDPSSLSRLKGDCAIGHVRYSTTGSATIENAQPLTFGFLNGNLAIAHNGNIINAHQLHSHLERRGSIFQTTSDTEVLAHLIARTGLSTLEEGVLESISMLKGGFAYVILSDHVMIALRDPHGLRPLVLGQFEDSYVVASESCAFDTIGARFIRDVEPGEMLIFDQDGMRSVFYAGQNQKALCTFEYIYFARPDSDIDGFNVHSVRKQFGKTLAKQHPAEADVVIGVPDSSISSAIGYAEESGIPYEIGLIKNRYIGRTFIQPSQELRERGVKLKLSAVRGVVEGKRVVMIDDSIVRGTTSRRLVQLLREAGADEVHVRISSPPVTHSCYYGIDTSSAGELIASSKSVSEICEFIGADSLDFLSEEKMMQVFGVEAGQQHSYCNACFTGKYPTEIYERLSKFNFERQG